MRGNRSITTFKKLPTTKPGNKAKAQELHVVMDMAQNQRCPNRIWPKIWLASLGGQRQ
jgi:hypothetical protein